jgi:type III secretory pathway component EscS
MLQSLSDYEVHLDPAMDEMIAAVRALLLAAHWHTFSIVSDDTADATAVRSSLARFGGLPSPPAMAPVIRSDAKPEAVFHRLAELQRATRGVVLLAARPAVARRVLVEAGRLHMLSSDWVWLVLDTNELVAALPSELLPVGLLSLKLRTTALQAKQTLRGVIKLLGKVTRLAVTRSWLGLGDNIKRLVGNENILRSSLQGNSQGTLPALVDNC